jgi:hypothetical protein
MARAESADQADIPDGMSIPKELAGREDQLAKLAEARAKLETRAKERFERPRHRHDARVFVGSGWSLGCDALIAATAAAFTTTECANYIANSGYRHQT